MVTTAILGKVGLDLFEIFSFENYYNQNITRYFKAVGLEGDYYDLKDTVDFTYWLEYFVDGILDELRRIRKTLPETMPVPPRLEPHHNKFLITSMSKAVLHNVNTEVSQPAALQQENWILKNYWIWV